MFVQFVHVLLIIMYTVIHIVHRILVVKRMYVVKFNVVLVVILDKSRKTFFFCSSLSTFV